ncbi:MAG: ACP S-malonyltransferase [Deltaproteobacteria bacterium]|jgi:[acyl-carrier-protein] S-malonyltransferase|nr:ACP S-malonyltransferase [Deltaproteobacteria bacterium]
MTTTAFIFPGQGGQFAGQGKPWFERSASVRELFKLADEVTQRPVSRLCFEGPLEELSLTVNLQPAVLAVGLAGALLHLEAGLVPSFAAGHSLGEFGALCLAGVLTEAEVFALVAKRAALMQKAAMHSPGVMSAVLNLSGEALEGACELGRAEGVVVVANFNTPGQTVISGTARAVAAAVRHAQSLGGRAVSLPVSGAFHSPLMNESSALFADELGELDFKPPKFPVVPNVLGTPVTDPDELKNLLSEQMTSPVRWLETVKSLELAGVDSWAECWPRPYLGSMVKKCLEPGRRAAVACPAQ